MIIQEKWHYESNKDILRIVNNIYNKIGIEVRLSNGDILTNITKDYHSSKIHIDKDFYYKLSSIVDDVDFWSDEDDEDELIEKEKLYCCCYKWININRLKINELTIEELLKNKYQFLLNEDKKNSRKKLY